MNLKFFNDIFKTYIDMKSSIYILGIMACVQTVTFTFYFTYKYFTNKNNKSNHYEVHDINDINEYIN
jgi:hypothetical protein